MSKNLKIKDMPLVYPTDELLIPTGGFGDVAITLGSIMDFIKIPESEYFTSNPNLSISNGKYQTLNLDSDMTLTAEIGDSQYILVHLPISEFLLDYRSFDICNQFNRDTQTASYLLILGMGDRKLLFGCHVGGIQNE